MPRRSGTITVWSRASAAAKGAHMSPPSPKPWSSTTAGPEINRHPVVRHDLLGAEVGRERLDLRGCRPREGERPKGLDQYSEHGSSPPMIKQMCPDTLIWGHGSGHRTSAQQRMMRAYYSGGAARDVRC